jgi:REP element-mobilizing transposase RayT
MARPLRIQFPHAVYHVTARGNERKPIVRDNDDRERFVQTLARMVEQYKVICHAWVLMDNHYHLLIETPSSNLSQAIRHLNGVYTQGFNRRHRRVGHLFQGRFKAILVEKETYLLELCRYVVLNPVRAGMVKHPKAWPWSSYRATVGVEPIPSWLTVNWLLGQFRSQRSRAEAAYRQFVEEGITQQESPWSNLRSQIYLGGEAFLKKAQSRLLKDMTDSEIPLVHKQPAAPRVQDLLTQVAKNYGEGKDKILSPTRRPSEGRQVAIYLARRVAGLELKAIAKQFGLSYTGVSRRVSAVARWMEEDKIFRNKINNFLDVKVKT